MKVSIVDGSIHTIDRLDDLLLYVENIAHIHRAVSYKEAKKLFTENVHNT